MFSGLGDFAKSKILNLDANLIVNTQTMYYQLKAISKMIRHKINKYAELLPITMEIETLLNQIEGREQEAKS